MRSLRNALMFVCLLALAGVSANAQVPYDHKLVVDIPFSFNVGERQFAPGRYEVKRVFDTGLAYMINRADGQKTDYEKTSMFTFKNRLKAGKVADRGKLVFKVYDGRYILSQIWGAGDAGGELPTSKIERQIASSGAQAESVTLVALR